MNYTAEVYLNDQSAGKQIYAPYLFDLTKLLKSGTNTIKIRVTPGQLNEFISKAREGINDTASLRVKKTSLCRPD